MIPFFFCSLWHYLTHFMTLPAIVLRWIKIIYYDIASGCYQWSWVHGVQGVRLAPQTQEGSTVSHSQGGLKAGHLCSLSDPHLQLQSINNMSITSLACQL